MKLTIVAKPVFGRASQETITEEGKMIHSLLNATIWWDLKQCVCHPIILTSTKPAKRSRPKRVFNQISLLPRIQPARRRPLDLSAPFETLGVPRPRDRCWPSRRHWRADHCRHAAGRRTRKRGAQCAHSYSRVGTAPLTPDTRLTGGHAWVTRLFACRSLNRPRIRSIVTGAGAVGGSLRSMLMAVASWAVH